MVSLVAGLLFVAPRAHAEAEYRDRVPNGVVGDCATCHVVIFFGAAPRNAFGNDFARGERIWSAELAALDSDEDGQTNGEELGDPCGEWVAGEPAPRLDDVSLPGLQTSTTADPRTPRCPDEAGGCQASNPPADLALWLLLVTLAWRLTTRKPTRRRRCPTRRPPKPDFWLAKERV